MENAIEQGEFIMDALEEMRTHHPSLKHARIAGQGLMIGAELVLDDQRTPAKVLRDSVEDFALENGLLILGCGESGLRFSPALMIDRVAVQEGLERFDRSLTQAEQAAGLL